jgi:hypothetical protein
MKTKLVNFMVTIDQIIFGLILTTLAGLSTTLGAASVFFIKILVKDY